jgi:hypothetical protein
LKVFEYLCDVGRKEEGRKEENPGGSLLGSIFLGSRSEALSHFPDRVKRREALGWVGCCLRIT